MRHVGDEVAPHSLDALGLRHVARQEQLLRLAVLDQLQRERETGSAQDAHRRRMLVRRQVADELRIAHQVGDGLAEVGAAVDLQVQLGGVVAPLDAIRAVEDHHAIGQRL